MDNLIKLLLVLGVAVFVMVLLVERSGMQISEEKQSSLARYILPLVAVLLVIQLLVQCSGAR